MFFTNPLGLCGSRRIDVPCLPCVTFEADGTAVFEARIATVGSADEMIVFHAVQRLATAAIEGPVVEWAGRLTEPASAFPSGFLGLGGELKPRQFG